MYKHLYACKEIYVQQFLILHLSSRSHGMVHSQLNITNNQRLHWRLFVILKGWRKHLTLKYQCSWNTMKPFVVYLMKTVPILYSIILQFFVQNILITLSQIKQGWFQNKWLFSEMKQTMRKILQINIRYKLWFWMKLLLLGRYDICIWLPLSTIMKRLNWKNIFPSEK